MRTIQRKTHATLFGGPLWNSTGAAIRVHIPSSDFTYLPINNAIVLIILCASASSPRCRERRTEDTRRMHSITINRYTHTHTRLHTHTESRERGPAYRPP